MRRGDVARIRAQRQGGRGHTVRVDPVLVHPRLALSDGQALVRCTCGLAELLPAGEADERARSHRERFDG